MLLLHQYFMEQDTRLELAPSAWKADMLTTNTNPAYCEILWFDGGGVSSVPQPQIS